MGLRRRLRGLILRIAALGGGAAGALVATDHRAGLSPGDGALLVIAGALAAACEAGLAALLLSALARLWRRARGAPAPEPGRAPGARLLDGLGLALLGLLALSSERRADRGDPVGDRGPSVWLITLDTLRADHVSAIGGGRRRVPTPNLDALAARCTLFTRGVSPAPLTLPSHAAILTGQHPMALGVLRNGVRLPPEVETVADATAPGRAAAFVSSSILSRATGLDRGFARYDDTFGVAGLLSLLPQLGPVLRALDLAPHQRTADQTLAELRRWRSGEARGGEFIWVHLYDPHAPYEAPEAYRGLTPWDTPDAPGGPTDMRAARAEIRERRELFMPMVPLDLRRTVAAYADEVRWTDAALGQILALTGPGDRLIVAADHGESLIEHGALLTHGSQVYETTTRVPIIACFPDPDAPRTVDEPAPLQAIGVTLRSWLTHGERAPGGLEDYLAPAEGRPPLLSLAGEMQSRDQPMIAHGWELALRDGEVKWLSGRDGVLRRFLPAIDPGERVDTAPEQDPDARAAMMEEFARIRLHLDELQAKRATDADQSDALRALGYVE